MPAAVVSRAAQTQAIAEVLRAAAAGPSALIIEGEPGIGKTTLWSTGIEQAHTTGFRVLAARPAAAESVLAYASLADMLGDLDAPAWPDLPHFIGLFESNGARLDRAWMLATGARCRAMLLAAQGDVDAANVVAQQAMTEHARLPMPFERARTQLLLGQLQRRRRQQGAAASTLREALETFERMGAELWAARARAELARTKVPRNREAVLTPSERRVAELAASGMKNRDVAAALFISPKTVEVNLARIYRKLGIHSRAELGRHMTQPERDD